MDFIPAFISGAGADLRQSVSGAILEYRVTSTSLPMKMEILPGKINGVSESGALCEYKRTHVTLDTFGAGYEFCDRIPFGAEYKFRRIMELGAGWGTVSCDAMIVGPGNVHSLELGTVVLHGSWIKCRLAFADGRVETKEISPDGSVFVSSVPWRAVELADKDGNRFEIGTGDDWWRWVQTEDAGSEYSLEIRDSKAVYSRKLFDIPEPAENDTGETVRRKSWRSQWYWAWFPVNFAAANDACVTVADIEPECCKTPGFQRAVRNAVRKLGASAELLGLRRNSNLLCKDAAHLERPGKKELLHFDRCEALKTYLWANRRIIANGGAGFAWLTDTPADELFAAEVRMMHAPEGGFSSPAREAGETV